MLSVVFERKAAVGHPSHTKFPVKKFMKRHLALTSMSFYHLYLKVPKCENFHRTDFLFIFTP
jgi:hypothetical protein